MSLVRLNDVAAVFALQDDETFWVELESGFCVVDPSTEHDTGADAAFRARFGGQGVALREGLLGAAQCTASRRAIEALAARGLPPVFLYALAAPWSWMPGLLRALEGVVECPQVLADVWAWWLPPREGVRGWPPHRGIAESLPAGRGHAALVNVWVALSDVPLDAACMHVLPLPRDPYCPAELRRQPLPTAGAHAFPMRAGSVLVWDARAVHWGGAMSPTAARPRCACSFTVAAASLDGWGFPRLEPAAPPPRALRFVLVAEQLLTYAHREPLEPALLEWARLVVAMQQRAPRNDGA